MPLTITTGDPLPNEAEVRLVTGLNANGSSEEEHFAFLRADDRTMICHIVPQRAGLHSFRAEFSLDAGKTWVRDPVPDAWVMVDPPQVDALRLYVMIPTVSGTIADWKKDLKRIAGMGFNAIHLLPVTAMDTSESPYAASDLFDIDHSYLIEGSKRDGLSQLEDFIECAVSLKIRLCFDLVLNHVGVHSLMAQRAPDWIVPDQNRPDGLKRAQYWFDQNLHDWEDLVLINYEHPLDEIRSEIWAYMTDYALFWAKYADATGGFVRFDNLHSSEPDFIKAVTVALHQHYPEVGIIAEYFVDENTLMNRVPQWGLNLVLATPWNQKFTPQLRDYLNYVHRSSQHIRYLMPLTSHDSGSPAQEFDSADSTVPRYVAAALLGGGATGMPQGVELGEKERIEFIGRQPKLSFPVEPRFAGFIGRVNAILTEYRVFQHMQNFKFVDDGHPAVIAVFRQDTGFQAAGFLVVCNFDTRSAQRIWVDLSNDLEVGRNYVCSELLSRNTILFTYPHLEILLAPCEAQVLMFSQSS